MEPAATWQEAFAVMWNLLIDDIENCVGYDAAEAADWRRLLDRHLNCFEHFTEPACLLHMDVLGGEHSL